MKFLFLFLMTATSLIHAKENKISLTASMLYNAPEADSDYVNVQEGNTFTYGLGVRALVDINSTLMFRTGAQLIYKNIFLDYEVIGSDVEFDQTLTYLSLPVSLYVSMNDNVGFFGGFLFQTKISDSCSANGISITSSEVCNEAKGKDIVTPLVVGVDFNLGSSFGMELSYEHPIGDSSKDIKVKSLITSFLYHF